MKASAERAGGGGSFAYALLLGSAVYLVISDGEGLRSAAGFAILVAASYLVVAFARAVRTATVSSVAAQFGAETASHPAIAPVTLAEPDDPPAAAQNHA